MIGFVVIAAPDIKLFFTLGVCFYIDAHIFYVLTAVLQGFKVFAVTYSFLLIIPVKIYQWLISPWLPNACRYNTTCSHYTIDALKTHGPIKGLFLAFRRIFSCHQWGGWGWDPVPEKKDFTWDKPEAQKKRPFSDDED